MPTPEATTSLQVTQVCNVLVYDMLDYHNQHLDGLMGDEMFRASEVSYSAFSSSRQCGRTGRLGGHKERTRLRCSSRGSIPLQLIK